MSETRSQPPGRIQCTIDLGSQGRATGDLMLRWSDNSVPLGYHPIPVISLKGAPGPTVLILGGTHGDEFEGPAAIMRLAARLQPPELNGQVILIPALNAPAVSASARVSPLDGHNLNRAFPGDADGGPTAMLAHYVETELLPKADAVIDLHSGGKASFFEPCALATQTHDPALTAANMALARAFGLPLIWALGPHNDSRSVNGAAARAGVPMIATELGGGGGVDPGITDLAEAGLLRCLRHLGVLAGGPPEAVEARCVEIADPLHSVYAPADGLFDRFCQAGMDIAARDLAGHLHFPHEPERPPLEIPFPAAGHVLAHGTRGMVRRGDMLALVTQIVTQ